MLKKTDDRLCSGPVVWRPRRERIVPGYRTLACRALFARQERAQRHRADADRPPQPVHGEAGDPLHGGRGGEAALGLVVVEREVAALVELIKREQVSHLLCLPSLYSLVLEAAERDDLPLYLRRRERPWFRKAKALLAEAGYPKGIDAGEFAAIPGFPTVADAVVNDLNAAGIRVRLRPMERATFYAAWQEKKLRGLFMTAVGNSGNAWYKWGQVTVPIPWTFNENFAFKIYGAVGNQYVERFTNYGIGNNNYWDWQIGFTATVYGVDLTIAYIDTNLDVAGCANTMNCDARAVFIISKTF